MPEAGTYTRASFGYALARAGQREEAQAIYDDLAAAVRPAIRLAGGIRDDLIGLGDVEGAWTGRSARSRIVVGGSSYLRVNPVLEPLRGHPRFDALVRRVQPI